MSAAENTAKPRTYGNWLQPRTPGIVAGLGYVGSGIVFAGIFMALPFMMVGSYAAAVALFAATSGFAYLVSRRDRHGKSIATRMAVRAGWWLARLRRQNLYRAGTLGTGPLGTVMLPGLLARTQVLDAAGGPSPFGVVYCPRQHTYTIVLRTSPNGEDLVDREQVDLWVTRWGQAKADMGDEPGLLQYSVTIETAPANPLQLASEVTSHRDANEPAFAASVMDSIVETYPRGSSQATGYVAFTYSDRRLGSNKRRKRQDMLADLAGRIPYLAQKLQPTGAGACSPMGAADICRYTRIAYDPGRAQEFDMADMQGLDVPLAWNTCGPMAAQANWDCYLHDSGLSVTWEMTGTPQGTVQATVLSRLLAAQTTLLRKRVTWLFRPIPPERKPEVVDRDVNQAEYALNASKRAKARDRRRARAANQTAEEESCGAGLENFACLVSATIGHPPEQGDDVTKADVMASLENLGAGARLRLRPVYGSQDSAFAAALPLGLSLREYQAIPAKYTDNL